eukprot:GHVR01017300.1.p1 GENE.GHVR01017300.1~~GHVR01017300.1.p1  ORF type:complete len:101 (+),score=32.65 GHVR01017300.1:1-303(+)
MCVCVICTHYVLCVCIVCVCILCVCVCVFILCVCVFIISIYGNYKYYYYIIYSERQHYIQVCVYYACVCMCVCLYDCVYIQKNLIFVYSFYVVRESRVLK